MQLDALLLAIVQNAGTAALLWFLIGLLVVVVASALSVLLTRRHLRRRALRVPLSQPVWLAGYAGGFALIVFAAVMFSFTARHISADAAIGQVDVLLSDALRQHGTDFGYRAFGLVTHFGDTAILTLLCIAVAMVLLTQRRPGLALGWVAAIGGNSILNRTLKAIFERTRPLHDQAWLADGWSFPSGHASGAVVAYGMLAYVLLRIAPGVWHLPVIVLATAIAFSTGFSRIYLQVHYLSDVLAGFASGAAWLATCIMSLELARAYRSRRRLASTAQS